MQTRWVTRNEHVTSLANLHDAQSQKNMSNKYAHKRWVSTCITCKTKWCSYHWSNVEDRKCILMTFQWDSWVTKSTKLTSILFQIYEESQQLAKNWPTYVLKCNYKAKTTLPNLCLNNELTKRRKLSNVVSLAFI